MKFKDDVWQDIEIHVKDIFVKDIQTCRNMQLIEDSMETRKSSCKLCGIRSFACGLCAGSALTMAAMLLLI